MRITLREMEATLRNLILKKLFSSGTTTKPAPKPVRAVTKPHTTPMPLR